MAYPWKRSWKNYKEHSDHRHVNENLSEIKKKKQAGKGFAESYSQRDCRRDYKGNSRHSSMICLLQIEDKNYSVHYLVCCHLALAFFFLFTCA